MAENAGGVLDIHVRYRRFDHSEWEFGLLVGEPFVNPDDPAGHRWVTVVPALPEWADAPSSLTVPIRADRLRIVDDDYRTVEDGGFGRDAPRPRT